MEDNKELLDEEFLLRDTQLEEELVSDFDLSVLDLSSPSEPMQVTPETDFSIPKVVAIETLTDDQLFDLSELPPADTPAPPEAVIDSIPLEVQPPAPAMPVDLSTVCWGCHQSGHKYSKCPQKRVGVFCRRCGQVGETLRTCPKC